MLPLQAQLLSQLGGESPSSLVKTLMFFAKLGPGHVELFEQVGASGWQGCGVGEGPAHAGLNTGKGWHTCSGAQQTCIGEPAVALPLLTLQQYTAVAQLCGTGQGLGWSCG